MRICHFSELEVKNLFFEADGRSGELEQEQAYIEIDITDNQTFQAGTFLILVGIINVSPLGSKQLEGFNLGVGYQF